MHRPTKKKQETWYIESKFGLSLNLSGWTYSIMNNLQYLYHSAFRGRVSGATARSVMLKKGVRRNFAKFTGKHLCQSLFFDKVQVPATLYEHISYRTRLGDCFWCLGACLSTSTEDHLSIGGNSKNVRAVAKTF